METSLKEAREKLGYSLDDVANILKIRRYYLRLIEDSDNQEDKSPISDVYIRGYKKMYCEFLGIEYQDIIPPAITPIKQQDTPKSIKKIIIIVSSVFLLLAFIAYSFIKGNIDYYRDKTISSERGVIKTEGDTIDYGNSEAQFDRND